MRHLAPLPEWPPPVDMLTETDIEESRRALERAMYRALLDRDPWLALQFASVLQEARRGK
jgi:hypothetical protein